MSCDAIDDKMRLKLRRVDLESMRHFHLTSRDLTRIDNAIASTGCKVVVPSFMETQKKLARLYELQMANDPHAMNCCGWDSYSSPPAPRRADNPESGGAGKNARPAVFTREPRAEDQSG